MTYLLNVFPSASGALFNIFLSPVLPLVLPYKAKIVWYLIHALLQESWLDSVESQ